MPGDPSSAAFHIAAAVLVKGSRIVITDMSANWTRTGFVRIAERMGARRRSATSSRRAPARSRTTSPSCELDVASGPLVGTTVEPHEVPLAIDELPLVALLGCFAEGETVVTRRARSCASRSPTGSRPSSTACAASAPTSRPPTTASSSRGTGGLRGGTIAAHGDHRLAMLGAVAGLASREGVEVDGMEAAAVSYPRFEPDLATLLAHLKGLSL